MKMLKKERLLELSFPVINQSLHSDLPVNIFVANSEGCLVWVNTRMLKAIKETEKSYFGKHLSTWGEEKWDACQRVIETRCEEGIEEEGPDNRYYFTNRKPIWRRDKSSIVGIIGVSLDITEQKQAQKSKEEFILNMSHDLRTPFTGVYTCAELSHSDTKEEKTKEYLGYIITSAKQWMEVVDNIFGIYKADTIDYKVASFDIRALLLEIQDLYAALIYTKGLQFFMLCESYFVETQYLRLKQILISLVSNAIKFTEQGYIEITAFATKEWLTLQIKDTGIGIPEDKQVYIFERFTKLEPSGKSGLFVGTGLGLYIAKQCIDQLKGKITLSSQPGKGALFQVEIPLNLEETTV
jgi:two-component system, OmpR family, aerobic respiration control sensor histidine kinase ArcB